MLKLAIALAALSGLVTGPNGQPVAGAKVGASPFEQNLDTVFASTNAQGEYSFDLPEHDYVLYVDAAGYEMAIEAARAGRLDFHLEPGAPPALSETYLASARTTESPLLDEQYRQIEKYYDRLIAESEARRPSKWNRDFSSLDRYLASVEPHRKRFIEMMGGFPGEKTPLNPRRELVGESDVYRTERVWLDALPGVQVYGMLLTPKRPGPGGTPRGAPRPALITQHGMGGSPAMTAGVSERDDYMRRFGAQAAERGYVVFAPYIVSDASQRSRLHRKAISVGTTLQILEQWKMVRVTDFLTSLPEVDPARIGFYGISWGGRTTLYAAAIDTRLAAVAVSGYFNQTTKKQFERSTYSTAYIDTPEEYAFFTNLITEFSDADLASLVAPRPLFIESGTLDTAAYFKDAYIEYTRAREFYRRLGVSDHVEFGLFRGLHLIHGTKAFQFLDRWLKP
ncbi:MAG: carboxypeptidase regulatory-like domain-containing protein [Acidobacteria bacterium]|nr:carboxypeptidase regulatory-like domain-containing protein [Acidobacteriota bacterium]